MIGGHAALLAWKSGRPVKIVYDRLEDIAATTKRHPSEVRIRIGVKRDGTLVANQIDVVMDGGAYVTLSPVVLSRGALHAGGPYRCPNVSIRARAVATNTPPNGAFRGFGAPQTQFAIECHMEAIAERLGMDPLELRRRNAYRVGDVTPTGQVLRESVGALEVLERTAARAGWAEKRERYARENAAAETAERGGASPRVSATAPTRMRPSKNSAVLPSSTTSPARRVRRGIGLSLVYHGAGFTGSGEVKLNSLAALDLRDDGRPRILAASTEIGQGTNTVFAQIAADALNIGFENVDVVQPDTSVVPNSGPTVASRTCMVVGKLVESAALALLTTLKGAGLDATDFAAACREYTDRFGALRGSAQYHAPAGLRWDDERYQGDAYGTYAWAVYVAEVSVDTLTCEIRLDDFVAVQEVGRVINPVLAKGQIEGGIAQGIGWALFEQVAWHEGRMANAQMTNYIIPTSMDLPPIRVVFEERPYAHGPGGAKGIGELPMDGPAPAIANAAAHAIGVDVTRIPITPELLMQLMEGAVA
jgi:CO/xanthine dehydrogenase Mo-binding subunit